MPDGGHITTIAVTFGVFNQKTAWIDLRQLRWLDLAGMLTRHTVGPKEGTCFVPATFRGGERKKAQASQIDIAVLDSDSGATLEEIQATLAARGYNGIISSTHSHGTTRTRVKKSNWEKFFGAADDPVTAAEQFLIQEKGYLPRVAVDAHIVAEDGEHVTFEHQPCPKFRVVVPLARPWKASDFPSQEAANAAWKNCIEALAAELGLNHDQSCTDTSRLFYRQ